MSKNTANRPPFGHLFSETHARFIAVRDMVVEILPRNPHTLKLDPYAHPPVAVAVRMAKGGAIPQELLDKVNAHARTKIDQRKNVDTDRQGNEHLVLLAALVSDTDIMTGGQWATIVQRMLGLTDTQTREMVDAVHAVSHAAEKINWQAA